MVFLPPGRRGGPGQAGPRVDNFILDLRDLPEDRVGKVSGLTMEIEALEMDWLFPPGILQIPPSVLILGFLSFLLNF